MKLKKKTSLMMFTATAVAAVGVAAVSFAAWTGDNKTQVAQAASGSAYLFGFEQAPSEIDLGKIVPYDQKGASIKEGANIVSAKIADFTVYENYTITVTSNSPLAFYAYVGAEQIAVPEGWSAAETGEWKSIANGSEAVFTFEYAPEGDTGSKVVDDAYISLMLVSENENEMNSDAYEITISLETADPYAE